MTGKTLDKLKQLLRSNVRSPASSELNPADVAVYEAVRLLLLYLLNHAVITPDGKIPGMYDDIEEYDSFDSLPQPGESGKMYSVDGELYVWDGTEYKEAAGKDVVSALTAHTSDTTIHVTAADKTTWNNKQSALSAQQLANIAAVPDKANKPALFTVGNLAEFDANGNPTNSGKSFEDIQNQIDTESPLVARSFPVQQQTGWTEGDVSPTADSDLKMYLRPRFFGMKGGDLLKGIVLRTRSSGRTPFPSGVYMRLKRYPDGQILGVSELTVWPDKADTDVVFRFPQAIELLFSSDDYYTFDFSTTPDGDAVKLGMRAYVMPSGTTHPDFYYIRSTYVPIATAQFYSWEALDSTVTKDSTNPVKSSGIWSELWGALATLPTGFTSLYDWCVGNLASKATKPVFFTAGNLAELNEYGNPVDSGIAVNTANGKVVVILARDGEETTSGLRIKKPGLLNLSGTFNTTSHVYSGVKVYRDGVLKWYTYDNSANGIARIQDLRYTLGGSTAADRSVRYIAVSGATQTLSVMPAAVSGKVRDFIVDVTNTSQAASVIDFEGLGDTWDAVVKSGESLSSMTTLAAGEMARFYFTETAFVGNRPVFLVVKDVVEAPSSAQADYSLNTDGTVSTEGDPNSDGTLSIEAAPNDDGTVSVEAS